MFGWFKRPVTFAAYVKSLKKVLRAQEHEYEAYTQRQKQAEKDASALDDEVTNSIYIRVPTMQHARAPEVATLLEAHGIYINAGTYKDQDATMEAILAAEGVSDFASLQQKCNAQLLDTVEKQKAIEALSAHVDSKSAALPRAVVRYNQRQTTDKRLTTATLQDFQRTRNLGERVAWVFDAVLHPFRFAALSSLAKMADASQKLDAFNNVLTTRDLAFDANNRSHEDYARIMAAIQNHEAIRGRQLDDLYSALHKRLDDQPFANAWIKLLPQDRRAEFADMLVKRYGLDRIAASAQAAADVTLEKMRNTRTLVETFSDKKWKNWKLPVDYFNQSQKSLRHVIDRSAKVASTLDQLRTLTKQFNSATDPQAVEDRNIGRTMNAFWLYMANPAYAQVDLSKYMTQPDANSLYVDMNDTDALGTAFQDAADDFGPALQSLSPKASAIESGQGHQEHDSLNHDSHDDDDMENSGTGIPMGSQHLHL